MKNMALKLKTRSRQLRVTPTDAEKKLWHCLRSRQLGSLKFRRQHPIGFFIADFACLEIKLIVEADGGQHAENSNDVSRTNYLRSDGWCVLRFWNNEVLENIEGVLQTILAEAQKLTPVFQVPSPSHRKGDGPLPLPQAGEGNRSPPCP